MIYWLSIFNWWIQYCLCKWSEKSAREERATENRRVIFSVSFFKWPKFSSSTHFTMDKYFRQRIKFVIPLMFAILLGVVGKKLHFHVHFFFFLFYFSTLNTQHSTIPSESFPFVLDDVNNEWGHHVQVIHCNIWHGFFLLYLFFSVRFIFF